MVTTIAAFCSASLPSSRFTDPSPPLWGSAKSPVMGLPDFPVPDAGFVVELLLSLLSVSVSVLGSLCLKMIVNAPLIQMVVQEAHTVRPNAILAKFHLDSHILRDEGCFAQRWLKRRISIMTMLERPWILISEFSICLAVCILFVFIVCRCRMTLPN